MNEVEQRNKELEEQLYTLRERSVRLVDMERRHCLEYLPSKGKNRVINKIINKIHITIYEPSFY